MLGRSRHLRRVHYSEVYFYLRVYTVKAHLSVFSKDWDFSDIETFGPNTFLESYCPHWT